MYLWDLSSSLIMIWVYRFCLVTDLRDLGPGKEHTENRGVPDLTVMPIKLCFTICLPRLRDSLVFLFV